MYFSLETGCRPNEAAYLVLANHFRKTSVNLGCDYVAIVPADNTKTAVRYKWPMKQKMNEAIELVRQLHARAPSVEKLGEQHQLAQKIGDWFRKRVLIDCAKSCSHV